MRMEKYRGKNKPIEKSSKNGSFGGQKRGKCRWTDVSVEIVNCFLRFPLCLFKEQARKISLNEGVGGAF
jgi:hypothetical protein